MHYLELIDLAKLFRALHSSRSLNREEHHMAALSCFFTGARISQVLALRGTDLVRLNDAPKLMIRGIKGGMDGLRDIHVDAEQSEFDMSPVISMAARRGGNRLFGGLDRFYFNDVLKRAGAAAGLPDTFMHSHVFRHSAGMAIFDATQRIGAVTQFLLHRSPGSAYAYLQENDGKRAQAAMNGLKLGVA